MPTIKYVTTEEAPARQFNCHLWITLERPSSLLSVLYTKKMPEPHTELSSRNATLFIAGHLAAKGPGNDAGRSVAAVLGRLSPRIA